MFSQLSYSQWARALRESSADERPDFRSQSSHAWSDEVEGFGDATGNAEFCWGLMSDVAFTKYRSNSAEASSADPKGSLAVDN